MNPVVLFLMGAAAVGAIGYHQLVRARKRREELFTFAATYAFQFSRDDPFDLVHLPFDLFSLGDGRACENVLWGSWQGLDVRLADYWYFEESHDSDGTTSRSYHRFSVAVTQFPWSVPHVSIKAEGFGSRLAGALGFRDLQFESEAFNRTFRVAASDREFAYQVLDARMIQWLEPLEGFGFETLGRWLLVWTDRLDPGQLTALLAGMEGFREHVPRLVWNEYRPDALDHEERSAP
ncbi:MAG TPA: hypothetical protein VKA30_07555 [Actinomycetota bacterium]|nr:hypothetical protein [Actinomycetota bacterium]